MLKTLAVVMCFVLFAGVFAVAQANEVEGKAHNLPRILPDVPANLVEHVTEAQMAVWNAQLEAGKLICPTIHELNEVRQRMALQAAGNVTVYRDLSEKHARTVLARCRAQVDWAVSILQQTPQGRAYLERVAVLLMGRMSLDNNVQAWLQLNGYQNVQMVDESGTRRTLSIADLTRMDLFGVSAYAFVMGASVFIATLAGNMGLNPQLQAMLQTVLGFKAFVAGGIAGLMQITGLTLTEILTGGFSGGWTGRGDCSCDGGGPGDDH